MPIQIQSGLVSHYLHEGEVNHFEKLRSNGKKQLFQLALEGTDFYCCWQRDGECGV